MNVTMQTQFNQLSRKDIRYWCFRFNTESTNGISAEGSPDGLREYFEGLPWFSDWKKFGVNWDVSQTNPLEIVPLKRSLVSAWNIEANETAKELPTKEEMVKKVPSSNK